jgi:uncharacterized phiE125 gp8 family phage protein
MWYPATVTVAPASEPVTAAQVKQQCGIATSDTSYDDMIARMIATERGFVERYCGIKIVTQTVSMKCDSFCDFKRLAVSPIQSVTSVTYVDVDGATQTLDAAVYEARLEGLAPSIVLKYNQVWPTPRVGSRITVVAVAGYATVPSELASAMLLRIGRSFTFGGPSQMVKKRVVEGVGSVETETTGALDASLNNTVEALLENFRSWAVA